jgi:pimeloyl-ACP methyl ester carboxylesterase
MYSIRYNTNHISFLIGVFEVLEKHEMIGATPAVLYGEASDSLFLFVHGQGGRKEEAAAFAALACPRGWQVLGVDLPEHGGRTDSATFDPWHAVPELWQVLAYAKTRWTRIALRANSIGSLFSLMAFSDEPLVRCLLVSPLVDMERMIQNLMRWSGVTEERLQREQRIPTDFGQTLSWEYLSYTRAHPITVWNTPTCILRAEKDEQIDGDTVEAFAARFGCELTVTPGGEHWFHTPEELAVLQKWEQAALERL